jgi:LysR family transcriptional regulator, hydrogen peroxide-inducible genes activator
LPRDRVRQLDVARERLLLLEEGHCLRDQALALCGAAGARRMEEFRASSLATVVQMVINGFGCTILPELALPVEIGGRTGIRVVRFADPPPARTVGLAWRASSPRRGDFTAFAKLLIETTCRQPSEAA